MTRQLPDELLRHFIQAVLWNTGADDHIQVLVIDKNYGVRHRLVQTDDMARQRIKRLREQALKDPEMLAIVAVGFPVSSDPGTEAVVEYLPDQEFYGLNVPPPPPPTWRDTDGNLAAAVCSYREDFDPTFEMVTDPADFDFEEFEHGEFWKL